MEEKRSKDDEKKKIEKLEEVDKAYLDLMKAYSSCLSPLDLKYVYIFRGILKKIYSFSWDKVPGNDSETILKYLKDYLHIGWVEKAEIIKSDDGKTICIVMDGNSAIIMIDDKMEKAILKIGDSRPYDLNIKKKHGKLNIYPKIEHGAWLDFDNFYAEGLQSFSKKWYNICANVYQEIAQLLVAPTYLHLITYRIVRSKIRKKVDLLRGTFLLLITQNRNKIDSEVIKKFEMYTKDMDKLSAQIPKHDLMALLYAIIGVIGVVPLLIGIASKSLESVLKFISYFTGIIIVYVLCGLYFFALSIWLGKSLFSQENVSERERKIYVHIQEYLEFE